MSAKQQAERRARRRRSIRKKISGTAGRPRLTVTRSLKHIYIQAVDDVAGQTLAAASSLNDELVTSLMGGEGDGSQNMQMSKAVGKALARRLKEKDVHEAIFDRNGYLYHGRVKAVADGAREEGLNF